MSYHFPENFMKRIKDYGLPLAISTGILLYPWVSKLSFLVAPLIVLMLFFTFLKVSPKQIKVTRPLIVLLVVQIVLAIMAYWIMRFIGGVHNTLLAQGLLICFLCPAASASPVVIGFLKGDVATGTTFVLLSSLCTALTAPIILGYVGEVNAPFIQSILHILKGIGPLVIGPLLLAWLIRYVTPRIYRVATSIPNVSFWLWVVCLSIIIGKTVKHMSQEPKSMIPIMLVLMGLGLVATIVQFYIGKRMSKHFMRESVTLGQSLGQKNSTVGIWLAQMYLNPLSSVAMAAYAIWQNLFNSYQLIRQSQQELKDKK